VNHVRVSGDASCSGYLRGGNGQCSFAALSVPSLPPALSKHGGANAVVTANGGIGSTLKGNGEATDDI
jgi:hypothetical protein